MIDFYPEIRSIHMAAALASISLFTLRGIALFCGATWIRARPVRIVTYAIDTTLLAAAVLLAALLHQYPFVHAWLTAKVLLLVVYIALGIAAFWSRLPWRRRFAAWLAALVVFAFIYSIARAHHPLGYFARFL